MLADSYSQAATSSVSTKRAPTSQNGVWSTDNARETSLTEWLCSILRGFCFTDCDLAHQVWSYRFTVSSINTSWMTMMICVCKHVCIHDKRLDSNRIVTESEPDSDFWIDWPINAWRASLSKCVARHATACVALFFTVWKQGVCMLDCCLIRQVTTQASMSVNLNGSFRRCQGLDRSCPTETA